MHVEKHKPKFKFVQKKTLVILMQKLRNLLYYATELCLILCLRCVVVVVVVVVVKSSESHETLQRRGGKS